jgi:transposase
LRGTNAKRAVADERGREVDNIVASIGLDWADERHSVHLQTAEGRLEHFALEQKPTVLHEWVAQLQQRFTGGKIAVALEQRKGAVIHALLMYDCFILYPINPKALARYREAFRTSGAKDDPLDSELLLDLVVRHREHLRAWVPDTVENRTLQALCEQRRKLVNQRVALTNRITSLLKQYFPQALEWVGDLVSGQACDFLTQWPTLAAVQRARPTTIRQFYRAHNCRKAGVIEARLAAIAGARALTTDVAIVDPLSLSVQTYATQLRALLAAIQTFDDRIAELFAAHTDYDVFTSFPGAGAVCAPRLAAALGTDRSRWDSAAELQAHSGIAPVTERSGKSVWVHHRLACPKFVKQTFHEFADQSIRFSRWARAYYDQQRARGNDHHAALRALAYKWIRILFRCWKERRPYDEALYIDALRRRGSPLAKHFA